MVPCAAVHIDNVHPSTHSLAPQKSATLELLEASLSPIKHGLPLVHVSVQAQSLLVSIVGELATRASASCGNQATSTFASHVDDHSISINSSAPSSCVLQRYAYNVQA